VGVIGDDVLVIRAATFERADLLALEAFVECTSLRLWRLASDGEGGIVAFLEPDPEDDA
jgi:hypothetical protein